ncbi:hypothetical protein EVAR_78423_1 [Eumeta japonica]|uniref:Uncharacterized protein n=1 Tax=Eumeta variegata TaxID=151549 RepID=A0A4C1TY30_EUMVA|nr:hypothetical protein EVAR_78423_1 [Eumeta japonica]
MQARRRIPRALSPAALVMPPRSRRRRRAPPCSRPHGEASDATDNGRGMRPAPAEGAAAVLDSSPCRMLSKKVVGEEDKKNCQREKNKERRERKRERESTCTVPLSKHELNVRAQRERERKIDPYR